MGKIYFRIIIYFKFCFYLHFFKSCLSINDLKHFHQFYLNLILFNILEMISNNVNIKDFIFKSILSIKSFEIF